MPVAPAAMKSRRVAVLGSRSVGKSRLGCHPMISDHGANFCSLTVQFVENHFVESYYPTIENTFSKVIKYRGNEFATEIIDTAGQV